MAPNLFAAVALLFLVVATAVATVAFRRRTDSPGVFWLASACVISSGLSTLATAIAIPDDPRDVTSLARLSMPSAATEEPDFSIADEVARQRVELLGDLQPEQEYRGTLAMGERSEIQIDVPTSGTKRVLVVFDPQSDLVIRQETNSVGARGIMVETRSSPGTWLATFGRASRPIRSRLILEMRSGGGAYVVEVHPGPTAKPWIDSIAK